MNFLKKLSDVIGLCSDYSLSNKFIYPFIDFIIKNYNRFDYESYLEPFESYFGEENIPFKKYTCLLFSIISIIPYHYYPKDIMNYIVSRSIEIDYEFAKKMFKEKHPTEMNRIFEQNLEFTLLLEMIEKENESRNEERFKERFEGDAIKTD